MLYNLLFSWQKEIIDKFENRNKFALYLDMGLGKTPISLAFAERHKCNKIIIITIEKKASEDVNVDGSFLNWASKMEFDYNTYTKKNSFDGTGTKKYQKTLHNDDNDILIINYESLYKRRNSKNLSNLNTGCELKENILAFVNSCKGQNVCIILDESHKIKDLETLQTKAIKKIYQLLSVKTSNLYLYLLTGTPFTQGFIDLYSQLKLLGWTGNKGQFEKEFCIRGNVPGLLEWQQPIVGYKNVDKIYALVHQFGITIKSNDVIKLPEQVFSYHKLKQSNQMILYTAERLRKSIIQDELNKRKIDYNLQDSNRDIRVNNPFYRNIAFPNPNWTAETIGTFWLRARQLSIGFQGNATEALWFNKFRLEALKDLLENNPDNYVLFYNYTPELLQIYDICEELGYNIDVYCGEMKSEYFYNKFSSQTEEERLINTKNIIIANFASGSTGANWQLYNKCILFSLPLYKDYEQGIKRVHRIGQKNTVIYHIFYEDNWLDNSMLKALQEAKEYNKELFESDLKQLQEILEER